MPQSIITLSREAKSSLHLRIIKKSRGTSFCFRKCEMQSTTIIISWNNIYNDKP